MQPTHPRALGVAAALFAALGLAPAALAQSAGPEVEPLRPPGLLVRPAPGAPEVALHVGSVGIEVDVVGEMLVATMDLVFENPNDRVLEGRFVLPLPRGALPSRFAMEVDGQLRDASVVEKERARVIFEDIVRRGIDPGLLEWTKGNAFQARVFPIPAKGSKRIVVGYELPLDAALGMVRLPLRFDGLPSFRGRVRVVGARLKEVRWPHGGLARDATAVEVSADGARLDRDLELSIDPHGSDEIALFQETHEGQRFFVARAPIAPVTRARPAPREVIVFWDASGGRDEAGQARERDALARILAAIGTVRVTLVPFSDAAWPAETFEVQGGDAKALLARIAAIEPDGGTTLGAIALTAAQQADPGVLAIVCSDGVETLARGEPTLGGAGVVALIGSTIADHARLAEVVEAAHGEVIDVAALGAEEAARRALVERGRLLSVQAPPGVHDLEPARLPQAVPGARVTMAGRVETGTKGTLRITYGFADAEQQTIEVALDTAAMPEGAHAARLWARARVARLFARPRENETAIQDIGRRFSLVTPFTSMLVLETLADHIRYRVLPPAGEWRDAYVEAIEKTRVAETATRAERIARLEKLWAQRVAWWEQKVEPLPKGWRWNEPRTEGAVESTRAGGAAAAPSPGMTAPPTESSAGPTLSAPEARRQREASPSDASGALDLQGGEADEEAKAGDEGGSSSGRNKRVEIRPWTPDLPYLRALTDVAAEGAPETAVERAYARYVALRGEYAKSPAFFIEVADWFFARGARPLALRVLSNVAELDLESPALLRVLGHRYRQMEELERAAEVFAEVLRLRPEEPQSHRDLGLTLAGLGRFEEAIRHLETVVYGSWDQRFPEVELFALDELNHVIARAEREAAGARFHTIPASLVKLLDVDLRIVLSWDADLCDMDLWVVEPTGEKAYYGHRRTRIGGWFGRDMTGGYGPEEYLVRGAVDGAYKVLVNYYGSRQQTLAGATTVQIEIIRDYGRPNEARTAVTRRLGGAQETLEIAEVTIEP